MLNRRLDSALAALLLALLIFLQALSTILFKLGSYAGAVLLRCSVRGPFRGPLHHAVPRRVGHLELQISQEFAFDHAIEAYEELIDRTYAEGRA